MSAVDAPGTCHLVGCPDKGHHAPHGIGAGTWEDYKRPATTPQTVTLLATDVEQLLNSRPAPRNDDDADLFRRLSIALAVARNSNGDRRA